MRVIPTALAALFLALSPAAFAEPIADQARATADRLVVAMGGAQAWSSARGLVIRARHWEQQLDAPYDNLIQMSLDEPRMRFEGDSPTMKRRRAVSGQTGWRMSETRPVGPMTPEQVADDLAWWEAHAYRNIARLARHDSTLIPKLHADGRLELHRPDGSRLMWYRLNAAGEPIAFGAGANEQGTIIGPLVERDGGVRLPAWVSSPDGSFRAVLAEAAALSTAPNVDWERP